MTDLMRKRVIDVSEVKVFALALDEADNMLDQDGLGDQSLRVKKNGLFLCVYAVSPTVLPSQHVAADPPSPNYLVFCDIPRPRADVRQQICPPQREQD
jgi:hypothetical protein